MDSIFDLRTRQWKKAKGSWLGFSFTSMSDFDRNRCAHKLMPGLMCGCAKCHMTRLASSAPAAVSQTP